MVAGSLEGDYWPVVKGIEELCGVNSAGGCTGKLCIAPSLINRMLHSSCCCGDGRLCNDGRCGQRRGVCRRSFPSGLESNIALDQVKELSISSFFISRGGILCSCNCTFGMEEKKGKRKEK
jgi:hypothetical protein